MSWSEEDVKLVPLHWLKMHEEIKPKKQGQTSRYDQTLGRLHQTAHR